MLAGVLCTRESTRTSAPDDMDTGLDDTDYNDIVNLSYNVDTLILLMSHINVVVQVHTIVVQYIVIRGDYYEKTNALKFSSPTSKSHLREKAVV